MWGGVYVCVGGGVYMYVWVGGCWVGVCVWVGGCWVGVCVGGWMAPTYCFSLYFLSSLSISPFFYFSSHTLRPPLFIVFYFLFILHNYIAFYSPSVILTYLLPLSLSHSLSPPSPSSWSTPPPSWLYIVVFSSSLPQPLTWPTYHSG